MKENTVARLDLVLTNTGRYFLQAVYINGCNVDFEIFDWDGEGGGPHQFLGGGETWEIVEGLPAFGYDPSDLDSFHDARVKLIEAAKLAGIEVPAYAEAA